jgi:hypothetical protein
MEIGVCRCRVSSHPSCSVFTTAWVRRCLPQRQLSLLPGRPPTHLPPLLPPPPRWAARYEIHASDNAHCRQQSLADLWSTRLVLSLTSSSSAWFVCMFVCSSPVCSPQLNVDGPEAHEEAPPRSHQPQTRAPVDTHSTAFAKAAPSHATMAADYEDEEDYGDDDKEAYDRIPSLCRKFQPMPAVSGQIPTGASASAPVPHSPLVSSTLHTCRT